MQNDVNEILAIVTKPLSWKTKFRSGEIVSKSTNVQVISGSRI